MLCKEISFFINCFIHPLPIAVISQDEGLASILKPGTNPIKLAGDFSFTEGPASDKAGNVYFTDQPNDRIMIWSIKGEVDRLSCNLPAGQTAFSLTKGKFWSCADEKNELWCISPDKKVEPILKI